MKQKNKRHINHSLNLIVLFIYFFNVIVVAAVVIYKDKITFLQVA